MPVTYSEQPIAFPLKTLNPDLCSSSYPIGRHFVQSPSVLILDLPAAVA